MAKTEEKIRLKFRRPSKMVMAVVGVALVVCILAMSAVSMSLKAEKDRLQALKDQANQLQQDNSQLQDKIDSIGSVDSVEQIAKDELGLVDPDSVVVQPAN